MLNGGQYFRHKLKNLFDEIYFRKKSNSLNEQILSFFSIKCDVFETNTQNLEMELTYFCLPSNECFFKMIMRPAAWNT